LFIMSSSNIKTVASFVEGAPPGELADVIADIKALTIEEPKLLQSVSSAFERYNEEQLATAKLPGSGKEVLVSQYNKLEDGRYYDVESQSSFSFDHTTQKASSVQPYTLDSPYTDLITTLLKSLSAHAREHYPTSTYTIVPTNLTSSTLAILLVSNKYSPSNFWNGRWRTTYLYTPSSSSLTGTINVDVHYYEDGNVRLMTAKKVEVKAQEGELIRQLAAQEKKYQEELNRGFSALSEGAFKSLRRQLPVTRQKVEWEKVGTYRLGQDIGGGRSR